MEITPAMAVSPLFRGIPSEELNALLDCMGAARRRYRRGELILRRGDLAQRLGLVLSGAVHIVREDFWGNRTIVGLAESGEVFAESYACLGSEPLEVSALAAVETEVLFLDAGRAVAGCGRGCAAQAQLSRNLLALLAGRNLALTRKMGHMARRTTRDKVLSFLSAQALRAGGPAFDIPLDRQQLADYLAVDRSALSAVLSRLRDEGVLEFHKNHFRLLRPEQLPE
ncbi:Crp/Fnr family transcriptional regulator [Dysosmobacter sp.]|uniref:Crp/Fnr family transcriptional regulator n=1 Tax=Dysosmobacter sp. TaxID=2591382 RepID=UPI003AB154C1